jgi:rhamnosyltransferase
MTGSCRVSIVIPTFNAGALLDRVLDAIADQQAGFPYEIVAVDSGSTDDTVRRLRSRQARIVEIDPSRFNHGEARNQALAAASGEFAVLLVQDAVPASHDWLAALVRPLAGDPAVAGAFARQQPWPDASRLTAHYLARWVAAGSKPRIVGPLERDAFASMTPVDRHHTCAFDNVCSCIRMTVWRRHPFRRTPIAEDLEWALEVLLSGHKIAYAADAVVWHSHDRPVGYELRRTYLVHQRLQALFGLSTIPTVSSLARAVASALPLHARVAATEPRRRLRAIARGAGLAVALPLGQYLGARSAREGRELVTSRGI